jgi:hypothetical protein
VRVGRRGASPLSFFLSLARREFHFSIYEIPRPL